MHLVFDGQTEVAHLALRLARELAAQHRPAVGVLIDAGRLLGERLLPGAVERDHADREADHERDPGRRPWADAGPRDKDPDEARERGDGDEPLAADELLGRDTARDVDVVPAGGRTDHRQQHARDDRQADVDALLGADDRIPGQRERRHELEQPFPEQLPARVGEEVTDDAEGERQQDVGGVRQRRGDLADQDVARDAAAEAAEQRHQQDPDHGEVAVVVGPAASSAPFKAFVEAAIRSIVV